MNLRPVSGKDINIIGALTKIEDTTLDREVSSWETVSWQTWAAGSCARNCRSTAATTTVMITFPEREPDN
jgi:hypothetical protein